MTKNDIRALVMSITKENTQRGAARKMEDDIGLPFSTTMHHMQGDPPSKHALLLYMALEIGGPYLYSKLKEDVENDTK